MNNSRVYAVISIFQRSLLRRSRCSVDNSYLTFARTITRRARVRQLTIDNLGYFHSNDSIYKKAIIRLLE